MCNDISMLPREAIFAMNLAETWAAFVKHMLYLILNGCSRINQVLVTFELSRRLAEIAPPSLQSAVHKLSSDDVTLSFHLRFVSGCTVPYQALADAGVALLPELWATAVHPLISEDVRLQNLRVLRDNHVPLPPTNECDLIRMAARRSCPRAIRFLIDETNAQVTNDAWDCLVHATFSANRGANAAAFDAMLSTGFVPVHPYWCANSLPVILFIQDRLGVPVPPIEDMPGLSRAGQDQVRAHFGR